MKEYKVEGLIYHSKLSAKRDHIIADSVNDIQKILDEYSSKGWTLANTDKCSFGSSVYIHLYFERDV